MKKLNVKVSKDAKQDGRAGTQRKQIGAEENAHEEREGEAAEKQPAWRRRVDQDVGTATLDGHECDRSARDGVWF